MRMKALFHVTERQTYKWCRRQWKYAYKWHLVEKKEPMRALWIGRGLHAGLAHFYRTKEDPLIGMKAWIDEKITPQDYAEMWEDERQQLRDVEALLTSMLSSYVSYAEANDDFEIIAVEKPVVVRIPGTYLWLEGNLDLVVRRRGKLWVVDHKGYTSFANPQDLELDDQMTAYLWLVYQVFGELPGGAIYNQLRKKIPSEPLVLKGGGLSKDKSCDTTASVYRAKLQELGLDEEPYEEFLHNLEANEFFRRELIARSKYELDHFHGHLRDELGEMRRTSLPLYPNPGRDCSWACQYKMLCLCENTGGDLQGLIDANYEVSEGRVL